MNSKMLITAMLVLGATSPGCSKSRPAQNRMPAIIPPVAKVAETQPESEPEPEAPTTTVPDSEPGFALVEMLKPCGGPEVLLRVGSQVLRVITTGKGRPTSNMVALEPNITYTSELNECQFYIEEDGTMQDGSGI